MSALSPDHLLVVKAAFGCLLVTTVVIMSLIDCHKMILPDRLNGLLAAGGFAQAVLLGRPSLADAALGALFGFVVLSTIATLFRHVRGVEGLGLGDQKFSAAAGLWIGWQAIAAMLLIASCSALAFVAMRSAKRWEFDPATRLPFGPFLALGTIVCWTAAVIPSS